MRKQCLTLLTTLCLLMLCPFAAMGEETLTFTDAPALLRPGKTERISFTAPAGAQARLELLNLDGASVTTIQSDFTADGQEHFVAWDGRDAQGENMQPGNYWLCLISEDAFVHAPLVIGAESPQILSLSAEETLLPGEDWSVSVETNQSGTVYGRVRLDDGDWHVFLQAEANEGQNLFVWNGIAEGESLSQGEYAVQFRLADETGFFGTARQLTVTVPELATPTPAPTATPAPTQRVIIPSAVTTQEQENSYWTLPVGEMDEAAVWEIMMQPMTVIGEEKQQKEVYRLRKTPDNSGKRENIVGEITYASQGVHVLETLDNGWSLVETYNSSYGPDCTSRPGYGVTDELIQGYVKTDLLRTITPREDYGLLIDKLEQKMYIFSEGKCIGTLLVSTGLNNEKQSWNETPSGEFFMISRMGGFPAGNLWCSYGMRVNGGCAIHEVPYKGDADTPASQRDYSSTLPQLGKKASHGCIRVQKAANEQGQNIKWLWNNIKTYTKVLIWDDTGRRISYPDDDMEVYYNPNKGKMYHADQRCAAVAKRFLPLTAITYAELNTTYSYLTPCSKCANLLYTKAMIDEINIENGYQP